MTTYENSPACILLATQCAVCSRPLVDAVSVDSGIGPECRKKHGFNIEATPEARDAANKLVHFIAANQTGADVLTAADALRGLGFTVLADRILSRLCSIVIVTTAEGFLSVQTPYNPESLDGFRALRCRPFDRENKANIIPTVKRAALWALLTRHFPGAMGRSDKGVFVVPSDRIAA